MIDALFANLELGMPFYAAAIQAGIPEATARFWRDKYPDFAAKAAQARFSGMRNALVRGHARGGASFAQWFLEHGFPDDFGGSKPEAPDAPGKKITIEGGLPRPEK